MSQLPHHALLATGVAVTPPTPVAPPGIFANPDLTGTGYPWMATSGGFTVVTPGYLTGDGTGGPFFYQPESYYLSPMLAGTYRLSVYISSITEGSVRCVFNNYAIDQAVSALGLNTIQFNFGGGGDTTFNLQSNNFKGTIEYIQLTRL